MPGVESAQRARRPAHSVLSITLDPYVVRCIMGLKEVIHVARLEQFTIVIRPDEARAELPHVFAMIEEEVEGEDEPVHGGAAGSS